MKHIIFTTVIFFVFNIFLYDLHSQEVDLVKLKKKEEERKKKTKKSNHVLTNDNLDKIDVPKKPHAFIKAEKKEGSDKTNVSLGSSSHSETGKKQNKEYWQREMKKLLDEKNMVEAAYYKMQDELKQRKIEYDVEGVHTKRVTLENRINELIRLIPEYKQRLQRLEEEIKALQERARKAGVPASWLRNVQTAPPPSTDAPVKKDD